MPTRNLSLCLGQLGKRVATRTFVTSYRDHIGWTQIWFVLAQSVYTMQKRACKGIAVVRQRIVIGTCPVRPTLVVTQPMVTRLRIDR